MKIVQRNIDGLIPYNRNQKRHDDKQIQNVANSIKRFGWKQPIVIDKNDVVVIGHCRLLAAKKLGLKEAPCLIADDLTEDEIRELRIADNKTNESDWDFDALNIDIDELEFDGFDFDFNPVLPFDEAPIETHEDNYEEKEIAQPRAKRGDIYKLGEHRLMCGDSTNADDIADLMDGNKARLLFTSPPYSDLREYEGGKNLEVNNICKFISAYRPYTDYQAVNLGIVRRDNEIVQYWDEYIQEAKDCGYKLMAWNVWDKLLTGSIGMARAFFPIRHEFVFVFGTEFYEINLTMPKKEDYIKDPKKMGRKTKRNADGTTSEHSVGDTSHAFKQMESVLQCTCETDNRVRLLHPAVFPVGFPAEYIKSMTDENDIVIEPFCGSGTTMIAAEQTGRRCFGMELEPKYIDNIIMRWEMLTGKKAELIAEKGDI